MIDECLEAACGGWAMYVSGTTAAPALRPKKSSGSHGVQDVDSMIPSSTWEELPLQVINVPQTSAIRDVLSISKKA